MTRRVRNSIIFSAIIQLFCYSFLVSCEDMFMKVIDVDEADMPPKLSITAIFDTDSGRLKLHIRDVRSLKYFKTYQPVSREIISSGTIRLYENDREVFSTAGTFDLSTGFVNNRETDGYVASFTGIPAVPGYTYRLEVAVEGYPVATATDVMPVAPIVSDALLDTQHPVTKYKILEILSLCDRYVTIPSANGYPLSFTLTDNSAGHDYYSVSMEYIEKNEFKKQVEFDEYRVETYGYMKLVELATPNLAQMQDNPDVESKNLTLDGEGYGLYCFDMMMLTDRTFAGSHTRLDIFALYDPPYDDGARYYPKPVTRYDPWKHGSEHHLVRKRDLVVTHHTSRYFEQYRTMAFQLAGVDFFTEPVFITSNMKNAYGIFSVQNSVRLTLEKFDGYQYSSISVSDEDFEEIPVKE